MWRLHLSDFDFDVAYGAGIDHQTTDALSQNSTEEANNTPLKEKILRLIVEKTGAFTDSEDGLFALDHDISTLLHPVTKADGTDLTAQSLTEFINAQAADEICQTAAKKLRKAGTDITINKERVLVRRAHTDGAAQLLVPLSLRQRVLALSHYPQLSGHPDQRPMYDAMRRDCFWPDVALDVYKTISCCKGRAKSSNNARHRRHLELFPATGPLEFIAMETLGLLSKTTKGNQHVGFIRDRD